MIKLTQDDLWDLSGLAWAHAQHNDDDPEYYDKFEALHNKLTAMATAMRYEEGVAK